MFNYSLDENMAKSFILNFEENGENIKVNLANGEDYPVPNTKENRDKLLSVMEEQVDNSWIYSEKQNKKKKSARNWLIYDIGFLVFNTIIMIVNPTILTGVAIGLFAIASTGNIFEYMRCKKNLKDIKKQELFLRNKKRINDYLVKGNEDVKENTLNPVKEEKEPVLTINDIHDMSYDSINRIIEDIDRDTKFGIDRPKVLTKRYLNINNNQGKDKK